MSSSIRAARAKRQTKHTIESLLRLRNELHAELQGLKATLAQKQTEIRAEVLAEVHEEIWELREGKAAAEAEGLRLVRALEEQEHEYKQGAAELERKLDSLSQFAGALAHKRDDLLDNITRWACNLPVMIKEMEA
jgi:chromosome segregation ATPase